MHATILLFLRLAALLSVFLIPLGCEERREERDKKGRVNIEVQTPAGRHTVDVEYPKDGDKDDREHHDRDNHD